MLQALKPKLLTALWMSLILIACNGEEMEAKTVHYRKIGDVPNTVWQKLSQKRIYFGHHSVGRNILDGLRALLKENPQIKLTIEETYDPDTFKKGAISHSPIGYNYKPQTKLDMFAFITKSGGGEKADLLFFKFCYVDFNAQTQVDALFDAYRTTFERLQDNHPHTTFIHLTTPLTTIQDGPRAWVKKIVGRPLAGSVENSKRHAFNERLRETYSGKAPVFDLAAFESTFPDGRRATFELNGKTFYRLVPDYTDDGGHLNSAGSKMMAEQLLLIIAENL